MILLRAEAHNILQAIIALNATKGISTITLEIGHISIVKSFNTITVFAQNLPTEYYPNIVEFAKAYE